MYISSQQTFLSGKTALKPHNEVQPQQQAPQKPAAPTTDSVQLSPKAAAVGGPSEGAKAPANPYATNILNAINGQLTVDLADNATKEELQSRLNAGFSGFMQGFNEAFSQLEGMAGFSPQIASEINETKRQVLEGLVAKGEELGLNVDDMNKALKELEAQAAPATRPEPPAVAAPLAGLNLAASQSRSFAFELVTQEGDKIQILLDSMQAGKVSDGSHGKSLQYASQDSFSLRIEGDLNEGELKAINDLLGKVNQLSQDFYNGDLQSAFDKALDMGFDSQQIQQFSLRLSQTTEVATSIGQKAQRAYQADLPQAQQGNPIHALGQYLKEVNEAYQSAQTLGMDKETFIELSEFVTLSYREEATAYKALLNETLPNS